MEKLLEVMSRLRGPGGCPWDQEQTHQSIRPQVLEECYELLEAIDEQDDKLMKEELGDVLLHVVFHSQLAKERGAFDFEDVSCSIVDKLIRRHPHVFGDQKVSSSDKVLQKWQELKAKEKPERTGALDGIPKVLPALIEAQEVQKKAGHVGFDWAEVKEVMLKLREEVEEIQEVLDNISGEQDAQARLEEEVGDLFFVVVNLARHLKCDAEQSCRLATRKFRHRFEQVEEMIQARGMRMQDCSLEEMELCWQEVKSGETIKGG
ncbi:MAG: nucleoside triphosphate pyrophosphohydrolase [Verrucomicrobiota bacterium]